MSNICTYATIEYYPNSFNNESINVAFIFHNATKGTLNFVEVKNKRRIKNFDDELNIETYTKILTSIKNFICSPFDRNMFMDEKKESNKFKFDYLKSIQNHFLNEFRLSGITTINTENAEESEKDLCMMSLYYDMEKKDRPKSEDIARMLRKSIKQKLKMDEFSFEENHVVTDITNGEDLKIDFKIGDLYIKVLDSKSEKFGKKIDFAKVWCFNKNYFDESEKKLVFALLNKPESDAEEAYIKILKKSKANIFYLNDLNELSEYIKSTTNTN